MAFKKWLNWFGSGLAIIGCIFVGYNIYEYSEQIEFYAIGTSVWLAVIFLTIFYGAAGLLLARAWQKLLFYLDANPPFSLAAHIYGVSQLAKYVPGNIFHLFGRQAIGVANGLSGLALVKSTVWELSSLISLGFLLGILTLPLVFSELSSFSTVMVLVLLVGGILWLIKYFYSNSLSNAILYYAIFLFNSGLIFYLILTLIAPQGAIPLNLLLPVAGAYIIAWLAGLLTPGAPAGIGVRELVLLTLLQQYVGKSDLLLAILFGRIITVGGDFIFYLVAVVLFRNGHFVVRKASF